MHPALLDAMRRQPPFAALQDGLPGPGTVVGVDGLAGSAGALLVAALAETSRHRVWAVVATSPAAAEAFEADVQALVGDGVAVLFPQRETLPYEAAEHHVEVSGLRVEALEALLAGRATVLVTTARALQERAEMPRALAELRRTLAVGDTVRFRDLTDQLEGMGFERTPMVEGVGEYAVRGGILDLFGFGAPDPVRLEFWGDEIVSIRHFDILDQRSTSELSRVDILPVDLRNMAGEEPVRTRRSLFELLPGETILVEMEAGVAPVDFTRTWEQVQHLHDAERRRGGDPEPPDQLFLRPSEAAACMARFGRIAVREAAAIHHFHAREAEPIGRDMDALSALLRVGAARHEDTYILCDNPGQLERLEEILATEGGVPPRTTLAIGSLAGGFVLESAQPPLRVLTDHEIFQRARRLRRGRRFRGAIALESLSQLRPGDFVVHLDHGIGRFLGLERVTVGEEEIEAVAIEYANRETLRVPVYRLDLIERWVPDREGAPVPRLHRIGGKTWRTLRRKTEHAIREMAAQLLELYAARQLAGRPPYSPDSRWQKEMESSFLYEDTPDQRQATADVKKDLESRHPMDRLLCGDVGYGKTEVAVRAAFKVVQDGKQVALLAPTTILAEQHLHTFRERLAGYPVRVEALSRFRTAREQDQILAALARGVVDIVVGTHRLIEPDVAFRDLGLLVVDEEQRFGVRQKERFKEIKRHLDVLSLTATPIPRTLHLSLAGLRDMSLLQTPPRDRMPIITHVLPWVDEVLGDALQRELDRGGQAFVVHNRIQTIGGAAERVRQLLPNARVAVAHGQLPAATLDEIMRRFLDRETDILVTTAIIENGLDVPTANTLVVDRADQFGLAQLYQLRGRVGRSHHRAYCYLIVPEGVTEEAEKRLRILEHFTELGSGYAIALKDLELRGAGNILGAEQSGFVHAVGLDTYTRLLERTIRRLRGEAPEEHHPTEVSLEGAAFLADDYIVESSQKLQLYRRLSRLEEVGRLRALRGEVRDRFGPPPPETERLFDAVLLRLLGTAAGVERIRLQGDAARISFRPDCSPRLAPLQSVFQDQQVEVEVRRTAPLTLVLQRCGARSMVDVLEVVLETLAGAGDRVAA